MTSFLRVPGTFLLCICLGISSTNPRPGAKVAKTSPTRSRFCYLERAALGIAALQNWYDWSSGLWQTTGWWNAANATTVLVNYSIQTGSTDFQAAIENTYSVNLPSQFLNQYYDDEGWWALAWIDAYDWTENPAYLDTARSIFADMTSGWDDVCGGGIWWNKDRRYKNAIANELFLSVAAHLANRADVPQQQAEYLDWAEREWRWFSTSGMINAENLINDGLNSSCQNNGQTTWSYNQGVILGALVELYQQDLDESRLQAANDIATATLANLTDMDGILHDRCEPNCGRDGVQFKGIFLRNLMALNDWSPDERYVCFATTNAQSIWDQDQGPDYQFGLVWSGPFDAGDAARQSSALDALIAAAVISGR